MSADHDLRILDEYGTTNTILSEASEHNKAYEALFSILEGDYMAKLKLTMACDKYDYLQPLREGQVEVEGIDLNLITVESGIRHERMFRYGEYDACEFSMSSYLVARGRDVDWLQAIPFFPRRMWGHKFCFIRSGSGIKKPRI